MSRNAAIIGVGLVSVVAAAASFAAGAQEHDSPSTPNVTAREQSASGEARADPQAPQQARTSSAAEDTAPPSFYDFTGRLMGPQPGPQKPMPTIKNPYDSTAAVLNDGRRLFIWYNCYGCHGGRAGGGMGPSLRDHDWLYGGSERAIFSSIAEGRQHGMPAWGAKLPVEQIWKLTAYITSMGTPSEPDAPPANPSLRENPAVPEALHKAGDAASQEHGD